LLRPHNTDGPTGFYYGSDEGATLYTGSGYPYKEKTTGGDYGGYFGMSGSYWQLVPGCSTYPYDWTTSDASAADTNKSHGVGEGTQYLFWSGGPGVDPNYNNTVGEAQTWGRSQAVKAYNDAQNFTAPNATIYIIDVENAQGWNDLYSGNSNKCSHSGGTAYLHTDQNWGDLTYFYNYIFNSTPLFGAVYENGDPNNNFNWSNFFGTYGSSAAIYEWSAGDFDQSTVTSSTGLNSWCMVGASTCAYFFAGSNSTHLGWQWAIPLYGSNPGDFDQFDTNTWP
jgi:hypothetical protein